MQRVKSIPYTLLLVLLVATAQCIVSKCNTSSQCPNNSFCNLNGYCQCQYGWILNCTLPALNLTPQLQPVALTAAPQYLTIIPTQDDIVFSYRVQICGDARNEARGKLVLQMYKDDGNLSVLIEEISIARYLVDVYQGCSVLESPYLQFSKQANGLLQQIIIKIHQQKQKPEQLVDSSKEANNSLSKLTINIKFDEIYIISLDTIRYFICTCAFVLGLICIAALVCCFRNHHHPTNLRPHKNQISHFKAMLPLTRVHKTSSAFGQTCSVCLVDLEVGDKVRLIPCRHWFHRECLEGWCVQNLTCPVCRLGLGKDWLMAVGEKRGKLEEGDQKRSYDINESLLK